MTLPRLSPALIALACALSACTAEPSEDNAATTEETATVEPTLVPGAAPSDAEDSDAYSDVAPGETIRFTGTEPFWGGEVSGQTLTYSTPENIDGSIIQVQRFAGHNGLSFSGVLDGASFDMAITPGECSDGMSDRTYPFTVTLKVGGEQRSGCAWTDSRPFSGPENP